MKKILSKLKEKKGEALYIDVVVIIFATVAVLVLMLTCGGTISKKFQIDAASQEVKKMVEQDGIYDTNEQLKIQNYLKSCNVTATISCSANGEIQRNTPFTIELTGSSFIGVGGIVKTQIPLYGVATGYSYVYWKD